MPYLSRPWKHLLCFRGIPTHCKALLQRNGSWRFKSRVRFVNQQKIMRLLDFIIFHWRSKIRNCVWRLGSSGRPLRRAGRPLICRLRAQMSPASRLLLRSSRAANWQHSASLFHLRRWRHRQTDDDVRGKYLRRSRHINHFDWQSRTVILTLVCVLSHVRQVYLNTCAFSLHL